MKQFHPSFAVDESSDRTAMVGRRLEWSRCRQSLEKLACCVGRTNKARDHEEFVDDPDSSSLDLFDSDPFEQESYRSFTSDTTDTYSDTEVVSNPSSDHGDNQCPSTPELSTIEEAEASTCEEDYLPVGRDDSFDNSLEEEDDLLAEETPAFFEKRDQPSPVNEADYLEDDFPPARSFDIRDDLEEAPLRDSSSSLEQTEQFEFDAEIVHNSSPRKSFSELGIIKEAEPATTLEDFVRPPRPRSSLKTPTIGKVTFAEFQKNAGDWASRCSGSSVAGDTLGSSTIGENTFPDNESVAGLSTISTTSSQRRVRFADEEGKTMTKTYITERRDRFEHDWNTAFILLLAPEEKKFEVLHVSYNVYDNLALNALLKQLPGLAVTPELACQEYVGICRSHGEGVELLNLMAIQECSLGRDEFLLAIPWGNTRKQIVQIANSLLSNRMVLKRIKAYSRLDGFRLHKLHSQWKPASKDDDYERLDLAMSHLHHASPPPSVSF